MYIFKSIEVKIGELFGKSILVTIRILLVSLAIKLQYLVNHIPKVN
jgi:hypothetical protein